MRCAIHPRFVPLPVSIFMIGLFAACALAQEAPGDLPRQPTEEQVGDSDTGTTDLLVRNYQLTRIGRAWLCREELELRDALDRLPGMYAALTAQETLASQVADRQRERIERQRAVRQQRSKEGAGAAKRAGGGSASASSAPRYATDPEHLGDAPEVRAEMIRLIVLRHQLAIELFRLRELSAAMTLRYADLKEDATVTLALAAEEEEVRLGPTRNYDKELARLTRFEDAVLTPAVPLYRQAGRLRFAGLVDDRQPVTFAWEPAADAAWLTASVVQRLGLDLPESAPRKTLVISGRRLAAVQHTLLYLRIGKWTFRDVPVLVLPAEAEDVGVRIGPKALAGHQVTPRPEQLRLEIKPAP